MSVNETQDEIIEEFEGLTDWMDRYAYIIDLGNTLPEYPESEKTPQNLIEQSLDFRQSRSRQQNPLRSGLRRSDCERYCCPAHEGA